MTGLHPPNFRVYAAVSRQGGREELLNIGVAYLHEDRKGLNVASQALPLGSKLVLREIGEMPSQTAHDGRSDAVAGKPLSLKQRMEAYERALIEQCLHEAGGRISTVMAWLGVPRRTLSDKMARFGIDRRAWSDRGDDMSDMTAADAVSARGPAPLNAETRRRRQRVRYRVNAGVRS